MNAQSVNDEMVSGVESMQSELTTQRPQAPLHLASVGGKAVHLDFDGGRLSSDAGVGLLTDLDDHLGLTRDLAAVLSAPRESHRLHFPSEDVRKQRVYQIAAGYEDAHDSNTLRDDPIFTLMRDRLPETGTPLASQPTISRFENRVSRTELSRMARVLLDHFIASYDSPPTVIVLDADDPEDRGHGAQEQTRSDGYSGGYGFLPCHLYAGLSGRLITPILKANRCSGSQRLAVLKRLVKRLRPAWPDTLLLFRGDSHFASPEVMPWIDAPPALSYVTGLTSNAVLTGLAQEVVEQAKRAYAYRGQQVTRCHSTRSQAGPWSRSRRVVIKVEVSEQGVNTRFVVTDLEHARPQVLSRQLSCARGQMENESTDHTLSLKSDRTSCHRFEANPCRLVLHSAASVLLDTFRREV
jgi:hypothetical protein